MPLDGKLADYLIDMSELKLNIDGLRQISHLLRHPEMWTENFTWDFGTIIEDREDFHGNSCGAAGCAIGVAVMYWGVSSEYVEKVANQFIAGKESVHNIFHSNDLYGKDWDDITPAMVANKIDEYLSEA